MIRSRPSRAKKSKNSKFNSILGFEIIVDFENNISEEKLAALNDELKLHTNFVESF
jgi:hypothetical protein